MLSRLFQKQRTQLDFHPTGAKETLADLIGMMSSDLSKQQLVKQDAHTAGDIWRRSSEAAAKIVLRKYPRASQEKFKDDEAARSLAHARLKDGICLRDKMARKLFIKHGFLKSPIKLPWGIEVVP